MRRPLHILRLFVMLQLLPALESGEETTLVGGQAVMEGVMMRSPHAWGIAVRQPDGGMAVHAEPLVRPSDRHPWMAWPVLRGVATLGHAMKLGFRALRFSADVALGADAEQAGGGQSQVAGWASALHAAVSVLFFIGVYKFLPLLATTALKRHVPELGNLVLFNLVDGAIRIALFLLFIWGVSRWEEIRRVFMYHGAEHKTVFAFEDGHRDGALSIARAQSYVTWHPRCGTSFLMTVMLLSIVAYSLVPVTTFWARFAVRIALLPVIAGLSYELIRYAARSLRAGSRSAGGSLFALLTAPGLWLQRITTQAPTDDQVECAIQALDHAMRIEVAQGGHAVLA